MIKFKKSKWIILVKSILLSVVSVIAFAPKLAYCSRDPWYSDIGSHWAVDYIYVLWQENVTDGYVHEWIGRVTSYFFPDASCTKAEFTVLLAKVFDLPPMTPETPSYPDVPKSFTIFQGKPVWRWIEAAQSNNLSPTPKGRYFYPDEDLSREDAVDLLVRCLDLYEYALSMPQQKVRSLLNQFYDGLQTKENRQHSMACAIEFGLIEGYKDGSICPKKIMLRCEAATVIYRSCLIRATADLNAFSPDGSGINDTIKFSLSYLKNRGISTWNMNIEDTSGNIVYTFNPQQLAGSPPNNLSWHGRKNNGTLVALGTYYYQAWVKDRDNRKFFSVKKPLEVINYSIDGSVEPESCRDDQILKLKVHSSQPAQKVSALFADGKTRELCPTADKQTWSLELMMGCFLPVGSQNIKVTGSFPFFDKEITLRFTRIENLWISPSISPNPVGPGQTVELYCEASKNIKTLSANLFENTYDLIKTGQLWLSSTQIPLTREKGKYPVVFTGHSIDKQVSTTIYLEIDNTLFSDLVFILID